MPFVHAHICTDMMWSTYLLVYELQFCNFLILDLLQVVDFNFTFGSTHFIFCMFLVDEQDVIATGGVDTNAVLFDRVSGQILSTLTGHTKKVLFFCQFTSVFLYRHSQTLCWGRLLSFALCMCMS